MSVDVLGTSCDQCRRTGSINLYVHGNQKAGLQARSKDLEILEEGGGAGPSTMPRRDHE